MTYHDMTTIMLAYELTTAIKEDKQEVINDIAFELACRYCGSSDEKTFESKLKEYGYVPLNKPKTKILGR